MVAEWRCLVAAVAQVLRQEGPMTHSGRFQISTQGNTHVVDITDQVASVVAQSGIREGILVVFVVGSTAGITTTEAEPGLMTHDLKAFFERIAPAGQYYKHEETWHDDNGHAHVRASALGPSLAVPIVDGRLTLGTWQQIVLLDFDTRGRRRDLVVQIVGA
jgi:secondary thiamine-phosphate synthase enzyme